MKDKRKLSIDWRKKQQTIAVVRVAIEKELDTGLPDSYGRQEFSEKCGVVFQHVFDNYFGEGASTYSNFY